MARFEFPEEWNTFKQIEVRHGVSSELLRYAMILAAPHSLGVSPIMLSVDLGYSTHYYQALAHRVGFDSVRGTFKDAAGGKPTDGVVVNRPKIMNYFAKFMALDVGGQARKVAAEPAGTPNNTTTRPDRQKDVKLPSVKDFDELLGTQKTGPAREALFSLPTSFGTISLGSETVLAVVGSPANIEALLRGLLK
jgi:hypothetical protein